MSSDEEDVRRPGRNAAQSPVPSDGEKSPFGDNGDRMEEDDDADLFGSDGGGSDAGLDQDEYEFTTSATN